ncbi:MAG: 1-deoxy-D-xylulose-5-phosphate reductoisomerase [Actinomycetaceae bacterium]|nr:1-deoxy-D-xylulose-5-phosphate reductoisomerase [Actinomycetaceae bacterium]
MPRPLSLLGSTGSIGTQALDIVRQHANMLEVEALAAGGSNVNLLLDQAEEFKPRVIALASGDEHAVAQAMKERGIDAELLVGPDAVSQAAGMLDSDGVVLNGITGGVGLEPTLAALESGATLALANKESLVVGAPLVRAALQRPGQVVPVDSEHSAIAQCLASGKHEKGLTSQKITGKSEVAHLVLTASGGPFRGKTRADLHDITPQQALNHPTWDMGPVVTINSSTLMNKGLELIEANVLFDIDPQDIQAVVHPQSIVHSMVTFRDGATIVQASPPDMHLPIALSLSWPDRWDDIEAPVEWSNPSSWDFEPVDNETFPALNLARHAVASSPTHPAVMNAANEVCVDAFIKQRLPYLAIVDTVAKVVNEHEGVREPALEDILAVQNWAVRRTRELIGGSAR